MVANIDGTVLNSRGDLTALPVTTVHLPAGVDVAALLSRIGLDLGDTGEKVSVVALAYAAHKAASPIRFPPTVALTPVVAQWLGKKVEGDKPESG